MIRPDLLNIIRERYSEERESALLFACYLHCNMELALKYKVTLENSCNYQDIAKNVVRPLYKNEVIDGTEAVNSGFNKTLLSLTCFCAEGKASSLRYNIVQISERQIGYNGARYAYHVKTE